MNCFQRNTRIDAPGSGAGPFQAEAARAPPPGSIRRLAAAPDCRTCRLETSTTSSSLAHTATSGAPRRLSFDLILVRNIAPTRRSTLLFVQTRAIGRAVAENSPEPFTSSGRPTAPRAPKAPVSVKTRERPTFAPAIRPAQPLVPRSNRGEAREPGPRDGPRREGPP